MAQKVIVRSNNGCFPYWIGEYQGRDKGVYNLPVVVREDGEKFWVMGIIVPYSEALKSMLDTLTPKEQWDVLLGIKRFWEDSKDE